jgi:hypothetical protein
VSNAIAAAMPLLLANSFLVFQIIGVVVMLPLG